MKKKRWWQRFKFWVEDEQEMKTRPESPSEAHPKAVGEKTEGGKTFFGIKYTLPWVLLLCSGCMTNYSTTKFTYTDPSGSSCSVEMPKEVVAKNLKVVFDAHKGRAEITADAWDSQNQGTIDAGTSHDVQVIKTMGEAMSGVVGQAAATAAKGVAP